MRGEVPTSSEVGCDYAFEGASVLAMRAMVVMQGTPSEKVARNRLAQYFFITPSGAPDLLIFAIVRLLHVFQHPPGLPLSHIPSQNWGTSL